MSERIGRDDLLALRAEYDGKLNALQAEVTTLRRRRQRSRHPLLLLLPAILFVALVPLATLAANPFNDLTGGVHDANIDAIYNAGITTGCDPNVSYCPNDNVTREQMASFLARTAGLGTNPPVANAKTAQSAQRLGASPASTTTFAANELVRTARTVSSRYTRDQDPTTPNTELPVGSRLNSGAFDLVDTIAITAPTSGFVIVTAAVGMSIEGTGTAGFIRIRDNVTVANFSPTLSASTNSGPAATTAVATTLSPAYVFPVSAGAHSFILEAQMSGAGTVTAYDGIITAIFVPFGSGGAATLEGE